MASLFRYMLWLGFAAFCGVLLVASALYLYLSPNLASIDGLCDTRLETPLRIYSADGKLIKVFGEKRRTPIRFEEAPPLFVKAILAAEDDRFEYHYGVDISGLMRAAVELVSTGEIQSGGSTITMQVAKNCLLSNERTFTRKFNEILLALNIESQLSKQQILELYFNVIFLGKRAHGIQAAAERYYGKSIDQLDLAQLAMIAGLPKAPSLYNPIVNPQRARYRRDWILSRMHKLGFITREMYEEARATEISARVHDFEEPEVEAGYFAEMVRNWMFEKYGEDSYSRGFVVTTTLDSRMQEQANQAVRAGLLAYDRRHGYRGPEGSVELPQDLTQQGLYDLLRDKPDIDGLLPGIVLEADAKSAKIGLRTETVSLGLKQVEWARPYIDEDTVGEAPTRVDQVLKPGQIIRVQDRGDAGWLLAQLPDIQGALVSLDPDSGAVRALVGGFHFDQTKFNRAVQARRQPGSTLKPFIYMAALENGITAGSIFNDAPVVEAFDSNTDNTYVLNNASGVNLGPTRFRKGLFNSVNTVSARVLQAVTIPRTLEYLKATGFETTTMPRNLQLAVGGGTIEMSPLELATHYAKLANGGYHVNSWYVARISDQEGRSAFRNVPWVVCETCPANGEGQAEAVDADLPAEAPAGSPPDGIDGSMAAAAPGPSMPSGTPANQPEFLPAPQVMDPRAVYIMNSILRDVIQQGTGRRARSLGRDDIGGKTGTTDDARNLWFSGFNREIVATAWVGFDEERPLGRREYGSTAALPIWVEFMKLALQGRRPRTLAQPDGIVSVRIDPDTGLLAAPGQQDAIFEIFIEGTEPTEVSNRLLTHPDSPGSPRTTPEQLF